MLVSVVIDNFNYERFVGEAIASALAQTGPDVEVEVVVVDDGSTDGSRRIIESFGQRVRSVFTENGGQGSAFNRGFEVSTGDVVLFLDADDRLLPAAAGTVARRLAADHALTKVQYRMELIDGEGRPLGRRWPRDGTQMPSGDLRRHAVRYRTHHWQPTTGNAYPRWFLDRVMPVDELLYWQGVDGYLNELAVLLGPIQSLDDVLAEYRFHGANDADQSLGPGYFHRRIELIRAGHAAGHRFTGGADVPVPPSPTDLLDVAFLTYRLASLRLDRTRHPVPGDRSLVLAAEGVWASLRTPMLPLKQRALRAAWFTGVGATPGPLASQLIRAWTPDTPRQNRRVVRRLRQRRSSEPVPAVQAQPDTGPGAEEPQVLDVRTPVGASPAPPAHRD
jgi:hypothetical protein